jgi:lipopolysaccharide heptosyltransferase I
MTTSPLVPLHEYSARRIAIIKPSALGDIVHSLPVLTALRQRFPAAHITWVVNRGFEPLLRDHPDLDATLAFERSPYRSGMFRSAVGYYHFFRSLRAGGFDLAIDLQGLLRSGLMTRATRASRRVGLGSAREGARWFYTDVVPVADFNAIHAVDRYWLAAEALGATAGLKQFRIPVNVAAQQWARAALWECSRPWLVLAVGSRWMTKRWPPEHFAALARMAQRRFGGTVVFVGSADELEMAAATSRQLAGPTLNLSGKTSLVQLAALLRLADVMIANDTGPLHLAAALGRPVVAPYTCTKVLLNGPYGREHGAVETRVPCQGSYITRCDRLDCMAELTPNRLWPILEEVLRGWESNSRSA